MSTEVKEVSATEEIALGLLAFALKLAPSLFDLFMKWKSGDSGDGHAMLPHVDDIIGKITESHKLAEQLRLIRDAGDKL